MIADWINVNDDKPKKFEEVIIASSDGLVRPVTYLGNGKFTTYLTVEYWTHMPEAPKTEKKLVEEPIKKRGRPKKCGI